MAQRTVVTLVDDLDGTEIDDGEGETVTFALDGQTYTIDLTSSNAEKLRSALQAYVAAGTRLSGGRRGSRPTSASSGPKASEVRAWATAQGIDVPARGRIPQQVKDQYEAAQ
ncbi:histone-like nucleoid-structuring protein Lsr2 [Nocardioides aurantiacus]|uniref:Lsr2 protein n=1 Tax=Nocardioides aurantiacus TaxID=86796 RepID=A0A3N2CTU3_9ACTN|nr:Lsr2 family protein [Nocardioides aurantiacus]ROR90959.1 Lsr2 protein [Nocardioides aurantiacus]